MTGAIFFIVLDPVLGVGNSVRRNKGFHLMHILLMQITNTCILYVIGFYVNWPIAWFRLSVIMLALALAVVVSQTRGRPRTTRNYQELPGTTRNYQELPGTTRNYQELPGTTGGDR